jgi:putative oxidoreductase
MFDFLIGTNTYFFDLALLVGRLFIGVCFVIHALGKAGLVGPGNMSLFVGWLQSLNIPKPHFQAKLAMFTELICGALLALGLFTRPACILLMIVMITACVIGHKDGGYLITNNPPGLEYALNLAVILFVFLLLGPGVYSLDAVIF